MQLALCWSGSSHLLLWRQKSKWSSYILLPHLQMCFWRFHSRTSRKLMIIIIIILILLISVREVSLSQHFAMLQLVAFDVAQPLHGNIGASVVSSYWSGVVLGSALVSLLQLSLPLIQLDCQTSSNRHADCSSPGFCLNSSCSCQNPLSGRTRVLAKRRAAPWVYYFFSL